MTHKLLQIFTCMCLFTAQIQAYAFSADEIESDFIEDELLIQFKDEINDDDAAMEELAKKYHLQLKKLSSRKKFRKLNLNSKKAKKKLLKSAVDIVKLDDFYPNLSKKAKKRKLRKLIKRLNRDHMSGEGFEIEAVYPNYIFEAESLGVNDSLSVQQYALEQINAPAAWQESEGEDVVVAVIDTGVDLDHKDLKNSIWNNEDEIPNNGIDDDRNGFIDDHQGWDFVKDGGFSCIFGEDCSKRDNDPDDFDGHGTHVAGIIAAQKNNNFGISGIAPKAKIMPLRAAFSVGGRALLKSSDILEALSYAVNNGADVINMSFAGSSLGILNSVISRAHDENIVLVAAAGNSGSNSEAFPAALDDVIAVGSLTSSGSRSSFSNFGPWVDIAAPGSSVLSTVPGDKFVTKSGTSMASPYVAGVAALIKSKTKAQNLSPEAVLARMIQNSQEADFPISIISDQGSTPALNADIQYSLQVDELDVPDIIVFGEAATFSASASDSEAVISDYLWRSDIDGFLSDKPSFTIDNLSLGTHTITLRVENSRGEVSDAVSKTVIVTEDRDLTPNNLSEVAFEMKRKRGRLKAKLSKQDRLFILHYNWTSDIDGELPDRRKISIQSLSKGTHTITLQLEEVDGNMTDIVTRTITVK